MILFLIATLTQNTEKMTHIKTGEEIFNKIYKAQSSKKNLYLEGLYYTIHWNRNEKKPDTGYVWNFRFYYKKNGDYALFMSRNEGYVLIYIKKIGKKVEFYDSSTPPFFSPYVHLKDSDDPAKFGMPAADIPFHFFTFTKKQYKPDSTDFKFPNEYKVWADGVFYLINTTKKRIDKIEKGDIVLRNFVWENNKVFPSKYETKIGEKMPGIEILDYDFKPEFEKDIFKFNMKKEGK